ncbi:hypothetical protein L2E82_13874 [Cichorium intybus]|uniref:Uncharacterized protein n=1 Tax=Cichorium intybus TaxID=13427 RepID=A0ACB9EYR6_CICIN|nr:hypothetical protein L2E82_13874 [Cichorium intybus]
MNQDYSRHRSNMDSQDVEDTAFYTQLTRQILLIMDEDDETYSRRNKNGASKFQRGPVSGGYGLSGKYFGWLEGGSSPEVPGWMESLWANSGTGTGVFIPRVVATGKARRKRHHKPRKNKDGGRIYSSDGQKIHG